MQDLEQDLENKYILWASHKTDSYGTYVFWKKNAQGYTDCLEECHIYNNYEDAANDALRNCYKDVVPISLKLMLPYMQVRTRFNCNVEELLFKQKQLWKEGTGEYISR